ncbi:MAG: AtpZ/AtpI family protein [Planctomycetota bacterium]
MTKKSSGLYRGLALVGSLSWTFVVCTVLCAFLGTFLDNTFRTPPVFLWIGVAVGVGVSSWQCGKLIHKRIRE